LKKIKTELGDIKVVGPDMPNVIPPVYDKNYSDQSEDLAVDGCVPVPKGLGLGVEYDWYRIELTSSEGLSFSKT